MLDVVRLGKAVGDLLRTQILGVLAQNSFAVLELCYIFDKAQPALSHHLKKLAEAGLVARRQEGTSIFYQRAQPEDLLTEATFASIDSHPLPGQLLQNMEHVYAQRVQRSAHFFTHQADALAQQTALICAPEVYIDTVVDCLKSHRELPLHTALEVGPGNGALLRALADHCEQIIGIDNAAEMLAKAQGQTSSLKNVVLAQQDFSTMAVKQPFDLIAAAMVLHHMPAPLAFFKQASTLLTNNGLLVIAELCRHEQTWVSELCADIWLGFDAGELNHWAAQAGMTPVHQQFLAQRNGFRVQVSAFARSATL